MKRLFKAVGAGPGMSPRLLAGCELDGYPEVQNPPMLYRSEVITDLASILQERFRDGRGQIRLWIVESDIGGDMPGSLPDHLVIHLAAGGKMEVRCKMLDRVIRRYNVLVKKGTAFQREMPVCDLEIFSAFEITIEPRREIVPKVLEQLVVLEARRPSPLEDEEALIKELTQLFQLFPHQWEPAPSSGLFWDLLHSLFPKWF